jgi:purine-binding chemotaxis protein CheW
LAARAKALGRRAGSHTPTEGSLTTFVTFRKGRQRYAIPLVEVREIQALDQFAPVPGAPVFVPGVIHWRGAILAMLDLDRLFELPEAGLSDMHVCLIIEAGGVRVAVAAGEIEDIVSVPSSELNPPPRPKGDPFAPWIAGVHDQDRIVLSMDTLLRDPRLAELRRSTPREVTRSSSRQ